MANIDNNGVISTRVSTRLEGRTRNGNVTEALRFRIHDPLWMLTRQWQLGEFQGNDAGSAVAVKCRVKQTKMRSFTNGVNNKTGDLWQDPLEPQIEGLKHEMTPLVRVESAMHYISILKKELRKNEIASKLSELRKRFPLNCEYGATSFDNQPMDVTAALKDVVDYSKKQNCQLASFANAFVGKAFDGVKLFEYLSVKGCVHSYDKKYVDWFCNNYGIRSKNYWDTKTMRYKCDFNIGNNTLKCRDYPGGRLSWYSFDESSAKNTTVNKKSDSKVHEYVGIPSLATYNGAPNKRLWEFEDHKVYLGDSKEMQSQANIVLMQYATMYSNDWMIMPLSVEIGDYVDVQELTVWDTFGFRSTINNQNANGKPVSDDVKWQLFTHAPADNVSKLDMNGLLLPPVLPSTVEGDAVEEVMFVRDEMANMIWGIETKVQDGCGGVIDAEKLANAVAGRISDVNDMRQTPGKVTVSEPVKGEVDVKRSKQSDFRYLLRTDVPLNWIPFVPQQIPGQYQEIAFRRGKMPFFIYDEMKNDGQYYAVRPISRLLNGIVASGTGKIKETPMYIAEEEILQTGTKLIKNYQRARWFNGKVYNWLGIEKRLDNMQANSGLAFDTLEDPIK